MKELLESLDIQGNRRHLINALTTQKYIFFENKQYLNFSSNDYLALSDTSLQKEFIKNLDFEGEFLLSNPSSRLMTGNSYHYDELETTISKLYGKEAALVLSSGFMLNSGVLPAITKEGDLIVADKLVHASIIDGLRLCKCDFKRFRHNDLVDLKKILEREKPKGAIYIVTESIFSMDGDIAPLCELIEIKKKYGAKLYVDEAHAFGVRGCGGLGVAQELGVIDDIDYLVATFGKALASQGAFVACDYLSREVMINKMRTLIFSTALPPISLMWSKFLIEKLSSFTDRRERISRSINILNENNIVCSSHIVPILIGDNFKTLEAAQKLKEGGIWCSAIRQPTVPKGTERLRLSITAAFDDCDIKSLVNQVVSII
ncbi:MAG: 8-amino-7-oxononanoate synthase [Rikenellaceae bacterium]